MAYTTVTVTNEKVYTWTTNPAYVANATTEANSKVVYLTIQNAGQTTGLGLMSNGTDFPDLALLTFAKGVIEDLMAELTGS